MRASVSVLCLLVGGGSLAGFVLPQEPEPLRGLQRVLWRPERAELWMLCGEGESRTVRVFDPWLRERAAAPAAEMPEGGVRADAGGAATLELWGNRRLSVAGDGSMRILPLPWESAPSLSWGPDGATVELRSAHPVSELFWRRAGEAELHRAPFVGDRSDGSLQRATFYGFAAGERIEIALPALQPVFPPRADFTWRGWDVPALAAGRRVRAAWPSE